MESRNAFRRRSDMLKLKEGYRFFFGWVCCGITILTAFFSQRFVTLDITIIVLVVPMTMLAIFKVLEKEGPRCSTWTMPTGTARGISYCRSSKANTGINGCIMVLHADEPLLIAAISVGGDLGKVQVFTSRRTVVDRAEVSTRWKIIFSRVIGIADGAGRWAAQWWEWRGGEWREDWSEWVAVGAKQLEPAWEDDARIELDMPVPIPANHTRAFYIRVTPASEAVDAHLLARSGEVVSVLRCGNSGDGGARQLVQVLHAMGHGRVAHVLLNEIRSFQMKPVCLAGAIQYEVHAEADTRLAEAEQAITEKLSALDQFLPAIGNLNLLLIDDWNGHLTVHDTEPLLQLPTAATAPATRYRSGSAELDRLWGSHPALRTLWLKFLGADARIARLREAVCAVGMCKSVEAATAVLDDAAKAHGDPLPSCVIAAQRALKTLEAGGSVLASVPAAQGILALATSELDALLLPRARAWSSSDEAALFERMLLTKPVPVNLASFSLLRLYGKGAYADVYAARKKDTRALFALKICRLSRVSKKNAEAHLRKERQTLAKAVTASPFLCPLRYAFTCGPYVALALPFYSGGTLQVQLEERAKPNGGLPLREIRWLGAQMVLALEALHHLGILHRDVKPSNVMLTSEGYARLADFGLSDAPGVLGKAGTRGYVMRATRAPVLKVVTAPPPVQYCSAADQGPCVCVCPHACACALGWHRSGLPRSCARSHRTRRRTGGRSVCFFRMLPLASNPSTSAGCAKTRSAIHPRPSNASSSPKPSILLARSNK